MTPGGGFEASNLASGLTRVHNTRDLGGTVTRDGRHLRTGRLFRSATLSDATPADIALLRAAGVAAVVDLRADWERVGGGPVPDAFAVTTLAFVPDAHRDATHEVLRDAGLPGYYRWIAENAVDRLVQLVELVAVARGGVLVQCGAGKDRTGVAVAVLLDLLGADDQVIADDFARTRAALRAIGEALARTPGYERSLTALPRSVLGAAPEAILAFLAGVRAEHGSVVGLLVESGLDPALVPVLRERLLTPHPPAVAPGSP